MKKILSSLFAALALMSTCAFAQSPARPDPATTAAVKKMLGAMDYRSVMQASMAAVAKTVPGAIETASRSQIMNDAHLDAEQRKKALANLEVVLPRVIAKAMAVMADPGLIDEMIEAMVPLYAGTFTVNEIEQLAIFYASPVGKKSLVVMPTLLVEGMKIGERVVAPRINAAMSEFEKPAVK